MEPYTTNFITSQFVKLYYNSRLKAVKNRKCLSPNYSSGVSSAASGAWRSFWSSSTRMLTSWWVKCDVILWDVKAFSSLLIEEPTIFVRGCLATHVAFLDNAMLSEDPPQGLCNFVTIARLFWMFHKNTACHDSGANLIRGWQIPIRFKFLC